MRIFISILFAYLIGAIPTAVWVGKYFYKKDVREYGSGNAGATNTFRVLGKIPGIFVLMFDVFKGGLAINNPAVIYFHLQSNFDLQIALGLVAVIGHIFPVYVGFRGGKGVAILLGIVFSLHPITAVIALVVFLIVFLSSGFVSLGSITAAIVFPIILFLMEKDLAFSHAVFALSVSVLTLITHKKNIQKLLKGEENRVNFITKNNP